MGTLKAVATAAGGTFGSLSAAAVTLTANAYTTVAGDLGRINQVTTGASDATITLQSAAAAGNNALIAIEKMDDNSVTVTGAATNGGLVRLAFASSPATTTFHTGDLVNVNGMAGVPQNATWACTSIDTTHIDLQGSTFSGAWTSGGTIKSGKVIVTDGVTTWANLFSAGDITWLRSNGAAWEVIDRTIKPWKFVYAATTTWAKPPLLAGISLLVMGGGGGGGGARRGILATARSGGSSGSPGAIVNGDILAAALTASPYTITVGAGGAGAPAVAVDDTSGAAGTIGGTSSFGTLITALGGPAGLGGTAAAAAAPSANSTSTSTVTAATGIASSITVDGSATPSSNEAGRGGAGGGVTVTTNTALAGGSGSPGSQSGVVATGGAGGANTGVNGTAGSDITDTDVQLGAGGGGGGGASPTVPGGSGANGGSPAAGGGGAGASVNGQNSGSAGTGGRGEVRVFCRF